MKRLLPLLLLLASACATTSGSSDLSSIRSTVSVRSALGELSLPHFDGSETVSEEADQLLQKPLTAEGAVRVALLNNREARAALAEVGIARGDLVQAGLIPNPQAEFEIRDPGGPQPVQMLVGLELDFAAALLAPVRAGVAEAVLDAERWKAAGTLLDLTWSTRVAFYEVQALQQKLELHTRALDSQQASYETALELSKVGNLPGLALANELAAVELARVRVAEAENALLDGREALTRKLGLSGARTGWTLEGQLLPPSTPAAEATEAKAMGWASEFECALEISRRWIITRFICTG